MDKKCLRKNNIESIPWEIWIRICFLDIKGSPSMLKTQCQYFKSSLKLGFYSKPRFKLFAIQAIV